MLSREPFLGKRRRHLRSTEFDLGLLCWGVCTRNGSEGNTDVESGWNTALISSVGMYCNDWLLLVHIPVEYDEYLEYDYTSWWLIVHIPFYDDYTWTMMKNHLETPGARRRAPNHGWIGFLKSQPPLRKPSHCCQWLHPLHRKKNDTYPIVIIISMVLVYLPTFRWFFFRQMWVNLPAPRRHTFFPGPSHSCCWAMWHGSLCPKPK